MICKWKWDILVMLADYGLDVQADMWLKIVAAAEIGAWVTIALYGLHTIVHTTLPDSWHAIAAHDALSTCLHVQHITAAMPSQTWKYQCNNHLAFQKFVQIGRIQGRKAGTVSHGAKL
jgi:hypothetical protein